MNELVVWLIKHADMTLLMRFIIVLIMLTMLWKALFAADSAHFDEAFKNVLVLLTGTTVGYFFNTSKGSSDKAKQLEDRDKPPLVVLEKKPEVEP